MSNAIIDLYKITIKNFTLIFFIIYIIKVTSRSIQRRAASPFSRVPE